MRVTTKICWDLNTWEVLEQESYEYYDRVEYCLGGASSAQNENQKSEQEFMQQLQGEQSTQFQNEQEAQNQVQKAWAPIVAGGAYQYGFSTAEDQQLQNNIINAGATATQNTENAAQLREQQATGGAGGGPAGGTEALNAQIAATGAQSTAAQLGQEKELGYETGRENFEQGTGAEEAVAGLANPNAYAGSASGAAGEENTVANQVNTANANSLTSKLLGGVIQGGLAAATGGLSSIAQGGSFGAGAGTGLNPNV